MPLDWDPLADESHLWQESSALAEELAHGEALAMDCARWPCIGVLLLPSGDRAPYDEMNRAMLTLWPGARLDQSTWEIDGVEFDTYTVIFFGTGLVDEDVDREVRLRRISVDLEVDEAVEAWAERRGAEGATPTLRGRPP